MTLYTGVSYLYRHLYWCQLFVSTFILVSWAICINIYTGVSYLYQHLYSCQLFVSTLYTGVSYLYQHFILVSAICINTLNWCQLFVSTFITKMTIRHHSKHRACMNPNLHMNQLFEYGISNCCKHAPTLNIKITISQREIRLIIKLFTMGCSRCRTYHDNIAERD